MPGPVPLVTPVQRLFESNGTAVWVKRDDQTHALYGGNKVRKLSRILQTLPQGAPITTLGAAGSHHALATTLFGRAAGHEVEAILVPQLRTAHVVENLRADLAAGCTILASSSYPSAGLQLLLAKLRGRVIIPVGGSSVTGALGYVDAMDELAMQVARGECPRPDAIVVPLGSGGTLAGILAGVAKHDWPSQVIGTLVTSPVWAARLQVSSLLKRVAKRVGIPSQKMFERFQFCAEYLGQGYGVPTQEGEEAKAIAAPHGITLDPTYTAKAFANVLAIAKSGTFRHVLYWHTLSSAPMAPLLEGAPSEIPSSLRKLLK